MTGKRHTIIFWHGRFPEGKTLVMEVLEAVDKGAVFHIKSAIRNCDEHFRFAPSSGGKADVPEFWDSRCP